MSENPIEDNIHTTVEVTVTTTRNSTSFIESERIANMVVTDGDIRPYNTSYIARSIGESMTEKATPLIRDTIARQFESSCGSNETPSN